MNALILMAAFFVAEPPKVIASPGSCQCGGAGNCQCGADCRCGGRLTLAEVYKRAEAGEIVEIAVGITPTGKQFACDAPWTTRADGMKVEKPKGTYRVYTSGGRVVVDLVPIPQPMASACGWQLINGKMVYICPNTKK